MVKKKRNHPDLQDKLDRPWCYYCNRDFDDLKILISHQKAKHFKCERCGRRLNTAGGLSVHMNQVHKETLTKVENGNPGRDGLEVEIFGMEGIPEDVLESHKQQVISQHYADIENRAVATGNPAGGASGALGPGAAKKPKFESPSDLKKRLAEHKARKAAQEAGTNSGDVTPMGAGQGTHSPAVSQSPVAFPPAGSPPFGASPFGVPPQQFPGQPGSQPSPQPAYPQPYGQPQYSQPPPQHGFPQQSQFPPQSPFPPQPGYAPSPVQQFGGNPYGPPGQSFPPGAPFQPQYQGGPPRQYGAASPMGDMSGGPPRFASPTNGSTHQRQGSLPAPPGLPQKPVSNVPHVNSFQLQQMHQGQAPPPQGVPGRPSSAFDESVDELISTAVRNAEELSKTAPVEPVPESTSDKKPKKEKEKDKNVKLMYYDPMSSPEEKLSTSPRYASFVPDHEDDMILDGPEGAVTGIAVS